MGGELGIFLNPRETHQIMFHKCARLFFSYEALKIVFSIDRGGGAQIIGHWSKIVNCRKLGWKIVFSIDWGGGHTNYWTMKHNCRKLSWNFQSRNSTWGRLYFFGSPHLSSEYWRGNGAQIIGPRSKLFLIFFLTCFISFPWGTP